MTLAIILISLILMITGFFAYKMTSADLYKTKINFYNSTASYLQKNGCKL